jgi:hypothetical protein
MCACVQPVGSSSGICGDVNQHCAAGRVCDVHCRARLCVLLVRQQMQKERHRTCCCNSPEKRKKRRPKHTVLKTKTLSLALCVRSVCVHCSSNLPADRRSACLPLSPPSNVSSSETLDLPIVNEISKVHTKSSVLCLLQ